MTPDEEYALVRVVGVLARRVIERQARADDRCPECGGTSHYDSTIEHREACPLVVIEQLERALRQRLPQE